MNKLLSDGDVWVLTIDHRHGSDTTVHRSEAGARKWLAGYVREWWDDAVVRGGAPAEPPEDDDEAVELYFDTVTDELFTLELVVVRP